MIAANGVTFGEYHSFDDLQLVLSQKTIGTPSPKTETVDIPGGDGVLDLTEFFGEVKYNNRTLSFVFSVMVPKSQFMGVFTRVQNLLHGRKMTITLDDDPDWYYTGRITVSEWKADRNIGTLTIDCDCEPFKYKPEYTVVEATVADSTTVTLTNSRKKVVPVVTITTDSGIRIEYQGSNVWELGNGSYTLPELELSEGDNIVSLTGSGTATFTWREGAL